MIAVQIAGLLIQVCLFYNSRRRIIYGFTYVCRNVLIVVIVRMGKLECMLLSPHSTTAKEQTTDGGIIQIGIFLCMRCAALHRKLGTHISKVKSLTMDSWSAEQVDVSAAMRNRQKKGELRTP